MTTDPAQLRREAAKLRDLQEHVDDVAMPRLAALLREHAAIAENMADSIETMVRRKRALRDVAHRVSANVAVLDATRRRL